jgi:hypothetical protein
LFVCGCWPIGMVFFQARRGGPTGCSPRGGFVRARLLLGRSDDLDLHQGFRVPGVLLLNDHRFETRGRTWIMASSPVRFLPRPRVKARLCQSFRAVQAFYGRRGRFFKEKPFRCAFGEGWSSVGTGGDWWAQTVEQPSPRFVFRRCIGRLPFRVPRRCKRRFLTTL